MENAERDDARIDEPNLDGKHWLAIMGKEGDTKMTWSPDSETEVDEARRSFDNLKRKGYQAYSVNEDGSKGRQLDTFDSKAARIIMAPQIRGG